MAMKDECSKFRETMVMDVYGELPSGDKEWEEHLKRCPRCSRERERLKALLGKVEREWRQTCPEGYDKRRLTTSIMESIGRSSERRWIAWSRIPSPGLTVAFTLCLAIGVVAWQYLQGQGGGGRPLGGSEDQFLAENSELFEEMELLQEMDLVQKLVQLIDREEAKM